MKGEIDKEVVLDLRWKVHVDRCTKHPVIRQMCYYFLGEIYKRGVISRSSKFVSMILNWRQERIFLDIMERCPGIERDHTYCPRSTCPWQAKSKSMLLHNGFVLDDFFRLGLVLDCDFHSVLSLCAQDYLVAVRQPADSFVASQVRECLRRVTAPSLSFDELVALCGDKADHSWTSLKGLWLGELGEVGHDLGGRVYHRLTNVKKVIRRKCQVEGVRLAEVDMHATFVVFLAARFAEGNEQKVLISWLQSGKFYEVFARAVGVGVGDVKRRFQAEVVFSRNRGDSEMVKGFRKLFPDCWGNIKRFRDTGPGRDKIVRRRRKSGNKRVTSTSRGQQLLSRYLTWLESDIFLRRSFTQLREKGIWCLPIHDCLMCLPGHAEEVRDTILGNALRVCGFIPRVKIDYPEKMRDWESTARYHLPCLEDPPVLDQGCHWDRFYKWRVDGKTVV